MTRSCSQVGSALPADPGAPCAPGRPLYFAPSEPASSRNAPGYHSATIVGELSPYMPSITVQACGKRRRSPDLESSSRSGDLHTCALSRIRTCNLLIRRP
jgi:hypothetical protein